MGSYEPVELAKGGSFGVSMQPKTAVLDSSYVYLGLGYFIIYAQFRCFETLGFRLGRRPSALEQLAEVASDQTRNS